MKRIMIVTVTLLALAPLARAEVEPTPSKKKAKAHAETTTQVAPRSSKQTQVKSGQRMNAQVKPMRANRVTASNVKRMKVVEQKNQNIVNNNVKVKEHRRFAVSGKTISFADARRFNWHERHDRSWWRSRGSRFVLYGGGYWFWNNGWWYPAYGYDPYYSNYVYDGPIYGYGYAAPGEVTAEVQQELARRGYYRGPMDGILGSMTRSAIERFQADHGLAVTAAIDEPTLASLGLA